MIIPPQNQQPYPYKCIELVFLTCAIQTAVIIMHTVYMLIKHLSATLMLHTTIMIIGGLGLFLPSLCLLLLLVLLLGYKGGGDLEGWEPWGRLILLFRQIIVHRLFKVNLFTEKWLLATIRTSTTDSHTSNIRATQMEW